MAQNWPQILIRTSVRDGSFSTVTIGTRQRRMSRAQRSMKRSGMMPPAFAGAGLQTRDVTKTEFGTVPDQRCTASQVGCFRHLSRIAGSREHPTSGALHRIPDTAGMTELRFHGIDGLVDDFVDLREQRRRDRQAERLRRFI